MKGIRLPGDVAAAMHASGFARASEMPFAYLRYHVRCVAAIRKQLLKRWPPQTDSERANIEANLRFFSEQCDYLDEFKEGVEPDDEFADDQIDAAM